MWARGGARPSRKRARRGATARRPTPRRSLRSFYVGEDGRKAEVSVKLCRADPPPFSPSPAGAAAPRVCPGGRPGSPARSEERGGEPQPSPPSPLPPSPSQRRSPARLSGPGPSAGLPPGGASTGRRAGPSGPSAVWATPLASARCTQARALVPANLPPQGRARPRLSAPRVSCRTAGARGLGTRWRLRTWPCASAAESGGV